MSGVSCPFSLGGPQSQRVCQAWQSPVAHPRQCTERDTAIAVQGIPPPGDAPHGLLPENGEVPPQDLQSSVGSRLSYWLVTIVVCALGLVASFIRRDGDAATIVVLTPTALQLVAVVVVGGLVAARRWTPVVSLIGVVVIALAWRAFDINSLGMDAALLAVMFSYVLSTTRRRALMVAIATVALMSMILVFARPGALTDGSIVQVALVVALAVALAEGSRSRRAQLAALLARAEQAEESRESEARRQVVEERLRIARDLHDGVAHQMAVINLHAGAARETLSTRPEVAAQSLAVISSSAQSVLVEISDLLAMLRRIEPADDSGTASAPKTFGVSDLAALAEAFRSDGLDVHIESRGHARTLSADVDDVVVRVVREGLTNALKHSLTPRVSVTLTWLENSLALDIRNEASRQSNADHSHRSSSSTGGHGLLGVHEWVESVGGTSSARLHDDQFRLTIDVPVDREVAR